MRKILLLSIFLIFTSVNNVNATTIVEDTLISNADYEISGFFGKYDFPPLGDNSVYDWSYTTAGGTVFQLGGGTRTKISPAGWLVVDIPSPKPDWYIIRLNGDVDGDGNTRFDWVILSADMQNKAAYKAIGITSKGTFRYSPKLNLDYTINGTKVKINANKMEQKYNVYAHYNSFFNLNCYDYSGSITVTFNPKGGKLTGFLLRDDGFAYKVTGNYDVLDSNKGVKGKFKNIYFPDQNGSFTLSPGTVFNNGTWQDSHGCKGDLYLVPTK